MLMEGEETSKRLVLYISEGVSLSHCTSDISHWCLGSDVYVLVITSTNLNSESLQPKVSLVYNNYRVDGRCENVQNFSTSSCKTGSVAIL